MKEINPYKTAMNLRVYADDSSSQPLDYRTKCTDIINGSEEPTSEKEYAVFMKLWSERGYSDGYDGRRDVDACLEIAEEDKKKILRGMPQGLYDESSVMRFSGYSVRKAEIERNTELYRQTGFIPKSFSDVKKNDSPNFTEVTATVRISRYKDYKRMCFLHSTKEIYVFDSGEVMLIDFDRNTDCIFLVPDGFITQQDSYLTALYDIHGVVAPRIEYSARLTDFHDSTDDEGGEFRLCYDVTECGELIEKCMMEIKLDRLTDKDAHREYLGVRFVHSEDGCADDTGNIGKDKE